jgi:predicted nucleic acid-binding protein
MRSAATANLYAESSAALTWLLGEPRGHEARGLLAAAKRVLTSELTLIECDRALIRAETLGDLSAARRSELAGVLRAAAAGWDVLKIDDEVVERARLPFPQEPIRTLDAIHLASALVARSTVRHLAVLSFDDRIRAAARRLGLDILPA